MLVFYICPDLAGEEVSHPNAFNVEGDESGEVTFRAIKAAFPLKGQYHFTVQNTTEEFVDCHRPETTMPMCNGRIFLHVMATWPMEYQYGFENGDSTSQDQRNARNVPNLPNLKKDFQAATKDMGRGIKVRR
jgi:hypothetical protein